MAQNRPIAHYIIAITMPIIIFFGGVMYNELRYISSRLHRLELYTARIGAKLNIEPLTKADLKDHSNQPAIAGSCKIPWGDSQ